MLYVCPATLYNALCMFALIVSCCVCVARLYHAISVYLCLVCHTQRRSHMGSATSSYAYVCVRTLYHAPSASRFIVLGADPIRVWLPVHERDGGERDRAGDAAVVRL